MTIRRRGAPTLQLTGLVTAPVSLDRADVTELSDLVDTSPFGFRGSAVPVQPLLAHASEGAAFGTVESDDGHYKASIPLADLQRGLLIVEDDGKALPRDRGGPFRLIVPDGRTLCWNVKSVVEIRFTDVPEPDSVPENPPH